MTPNDEPPPTPDIDQEMLKETGIAFSHSEAAAIRKASILFELGMLDTDPTTSNTPTQSPTLGSRPDPAVLPEPDQPPKLTDKPSAQAQKNQTTSRQMAGKMRAKNSINPPQKAPALRFIPWSEYSSQCSKLLQAYVESVMITRAPRPGRQAMPIPQNLTPDRFGRMLSAIEQGMSRKGAAAMVGIQQSTFNHWQTRANQGEQPYADLFALVAFAESRIELYMLSSWVRAAQDDWKAAQSYLEKRFPQEWGSRPQVTLTLPELETLSDEELELIKGDTDTVELTNDPNTNDPTHPDTYEYDPTTQHATYPDSLHTADPSASTSTSTTTINFDPLAPDLASYLDPPSPSAGQTDPITEPAHQSAEGAV